MRLFLLVAIQAIAVLLLAILPGVSSLGDANVPLALAQVTRAPAVTGAPVATRAPSVTRVGGVAANTSTPTNTPTVTSTFTVTSTPTTTFTRTNTLTPTATPTPTNTPAAAQFHVGSGQTYSTIAAAHTAATSPGIIVVHGGTYNEQVTVTKANITIQAAGDGAAIVNGGCNVARQNGIVIQANDVTVDGLTIQNHIQGGVYVDGNSVAFPARATIKNNTIQDYNCQNSSPEQQNSGVRVWYGGPGQVVTGNTITRRVAIAQPLPGGGNGIWFKSNTQNPSGGGHYIANNIINGGFDGIGGEDEVDAHGSFDRNTIIERNKITNCQDDGIQSEGGGDHVAIRDNEIRECGVGIAFAAIYTGPMVVERNVIYGSTWPRENLVCVKMGNSSNAFVMFLDNYCQIDGTAAGANYGNGIQQTNAGLSGIIALRNRYVVNRYVYELGGGPPAGSLVDYDCWQFTGSGNPVKWTGDLQYTTMNAFRTAVPRNEWNGTVSGCQTPIPVTVTPGGPTPTVMRANIPIDIALAEQSGSSATINGTFTLSTVGVSSTALHPVIMFRALEYGGTTRITGVSYNGVALTKLGSANSTNMYGSIWYLLNPTPGSFNLNVTGNGVQTFSWAYSVLYEAAQTNPFTAVVSHTTAGFSPSVNVVTAGRIGLAIVDILGFQGLAITDSTAAVQARAYEDGGCSGTNCNRSSVGYAGNTTPQAWGWTVDSEYGTEHVYIAVGVRPFGSG